MGRFVLLLCPFAVMASLVVFSDGETEMASLVVFSDGETEMASLVVFSDGETEMASADDDGEFERGRKKEHSAQV